jgi:hypothetical protein
MATASPHDWAAARHISDTSVNRSVAVLGFADAQTIFAPRSLGAIGTTSGIAPGSGPLEEHPDALQGLSGPLDDGGGYNPAGAPGNHQQQPPHAGQYQQVGFSSS